MILHALKDYYDRKAADPAAEMAPPGWEWKEISFILELAADGTPVNLYSTVEGTGKARRAKRYLLPQGVKKTSGVSSNFLWETPVYALGVGDGKAKEKHAAFCEKITSLSGVPDPGLAALRKFLEFPDKDVVLEKFGETWTTCKEEGANLTFQLAGEIVTIAESPAVRDAISRLSTTGTEEDAICLVTGNREPIARLHTAIKGVWGAQTSGANIVSFNAPAFCSYGKEQSFNAPVGAGSVFAYTTALNTLLHKDSTQRMQVGDASTVFWSARPSALELTMLDVFGEPPKDDPDRNTRAVKSLYDSPEHGAFALDDAPNMFYVLGLSPNASRISIRFWIAETVEGMAGNIRQHFEDLQIVHGPKMPEILPLFRLLVSTAPLGKSENIPPNLSGDTMRAILSGGLYPHTLLQNAILRIRAEREISYPRAALIKAYLNRSLRIKNPNNERMITMGLDLANKNQGYRLGRLFATLERIQERANPGINATIRDRFYGAASSTPVTVFGTLMRLKNHHLSKLDNRGEAVNYEKLLGEIIFEIKKFPSHLTLADQGFFSIGYYHQRQDFFTPKEDKKENTQN